ncbi:MAG: MarR family transcriptional regulator [Gammaproteobacteria bacterium]|nr:MarR family transcriptional regulator [Gammaproteobacteria bacterium]
MQKDAIDDILDQWSEERPELDTAALGVVIRVMTLYRSFHREATKALEPLGLELWEYDVLSALRRQGQPYALPATRLAKETDLSSGAMTNRIDRLEDRSFVRRSPDKADRRGVIISLTRAGRRVIDEAIRFRLDAARHSLQKLTRSERKQLAELLRAVVLAIPGPD